MNHHFGLVLNPHHPIGPETIGQLREAHYSRNIAFHVLPDQLPLFPDFTIPFVKGADSAQMEGILVFGGDGTILRSIHFALEADAPILGINMGRLGFLSDCAINEFPPTLDCLLNKRYTIQNRMLLRVHHKRGDKTVCKTLALNDAVIHKGTVPRLIDIRVYSNRRFVLETRCDGIVAASPTGTTAYSLSAGGPILSPVMEAIVMAPLNPHILSVRPMVFSATDSLTFRAMKTWNGTILQVDGQNIGEIEDDDEVIISSSARKISFIKLSNKTFYQVLRKKLHMAKG